MARTNKTIHEEVSEIMEPVTEVAEAVMDETSVVTKKTSRVEKKKFAPDDLIPCISIFAGEYFVKGERSGDLYTFASVDDIVDMRFDDLDFLVKRKKACVFAPRFIIQDEDFLKLNPAVAKRYGKLYSSADLKAILKLPANNIPRAIAALPIGAKESLKTIAATMIDKHKLSDINVIRVLDNVYGTDMLSRALKG